MPTVPQPPARLDGLAKLTGRERYVDDLPLTDFLWAATVRSPAPRGRIAAVRFDPAIDWSPFVIVDGHDLPGPNEVQIIETDQPVLASEGVRHVHEPVLLLAHADRMALRRAVRAVTVEVAPEPDYQDFRRPPTPREVQHGTDNVIKRLTIDKGDVESALAAAPIIVEGEYETGAQEHVYLETQGMIAWEQDGVVVVQGSLQCPYYVVKSLCHALRREERQVRVIQTPTGGGFGGKEDFPSIVALHAALLALKSGRRVKLIYDRGEDLAATTKRHPAWIRHRTGVDRQGRILAQDIEVKLDAGAYTTLSPVVLSRGIIHAAGPYACEHVRVRGQAVMTNKVPFGAFRGFGAPQTLFACERQMDRIAARLGLDPIELRRLNLIRDGQTLATGQIVRDGTDRVGILERAIEVSDFQGRRRAHARDNAAHPYLRRGIGLACFHHGAGFTGAGEVHLASRARCERRSDGGVDVLTAQTEMGQGQRTVFAQIAAARLGLPLEGVHVDAPDTARVPDSGPTVASRTTMVVGRLVEEACDDLLRREAETPGAPAVGEARYRPPPGMHWDEQRYRGDAYGTYAWACYVAEVEVDLRSFSARVTDFVAVQEIGRPLHEVLCRGQIQGGVAQGIGWALMEEVVFRQGAMANAQLTNYIIPTSADLPSIRVLFALNPYAHGAQGAKGVGELPMDGPAPAIANAIAAATGADPRALPLTPERIMELLGFADQTRAPACT